MDEEERSREMANSQFEICNAPQYTRRMAKQVRQRRDTPTAHSKLEQSGTKWNNEDHGGTEPLPHLTRMSRRPGDVCSTTRERRVQAEIDKVGLVHANSPPYPPGSVIRYVPLCS